jgi:capsid assembly protease
MDDDTYLFPEALWAGTEASFDVARSVLAQIQADISASVRAGSVLDGNLREEEVPYKLSVQGSIGVISIRGSLVNSDSPWLRYYDRVTSYHAIREALVYAASKPEIKGILLDVESGGGAVSGVEDTALLVAQVDKVKPVWAFSGGTMASAAYWLSAPARKIFTSKITVMGSIGTIVTHMEYSKQLKENGVGATVVRSGKFKGITSQVEPLSETAKAQLQAQVDALYDVFLEQVAESRGVAKSVAHERMGQGKEFIGAEAVEAGLADDVLSFDKVMSRLTATLDKAANSTQNLTHSPIRNTSMTRKALTEQEIAALAAGAPAQAAGTAPAVDATEAAAAAAAAQATAAAAAAAQATAAAAAAAATTAAAPAAAPAVDAITLLTNQVVAKDADLLKANIALNAANERAATLEASLKGLATIAAGSIRTMKVALGQAVVDLSAATPEQIVAEHTAVKGAFEAHFKVGGVAASAAVEAAKDTPKLTDAQRLARVQATRFQPSSK